MFTEIAVVLFLFFESLCGLFFALDVKFYQGGIFGAVRLDSSLGLRNIDVVYQIESCKYPSAIEPGQLEGTHLCPPLLRGSRCKIGDLQNLLFAC